MPGRAMNRRHPLNTRVGCLLFLLFCSKLGPAGMVHAQTQETATNQASVQVIAIQGTNWWIAPKGAVDWVLASTQMPHTVRSGDRIRTGRHTRLFLRTPHLGVIQIPPLSTIEIAPSPGESTSLWLKLLNGMMYFFHRGTPGDVEIQTRSASAAIRGTEFVAEATEDGGLAIRVVDGAVALSNAEGTLLLEAGQSGLAAAGQKPAHTPALYAMKVIQWCLYYPAVLDLGEVPLSETERVALQRSLHAYDSGDLAGALEAYPSERRPESPAERVYLAALWLAIGQVQETEVLLQAVEAEAASNTTTRRLANALRLLITAVRGDSQPPDSNERPTLASEWLARSYSLQSQGMLAQAREAARQATLRSPEFGFAWARLAELEFSFGRIEAAATAAREAVRLAPRHAAAFTTLGFQFSAQNHISSATAAFEKALNLDAGLADAWLGRGLCRIREGRREEGLEDLETAAAVEPQRAVLRSYLGKAFANAGHSDRAFKELSLAKTMDAKDPTAWLYQALLDQQEGRINEGIRNLQTSKQLNDERRIYRSTHLLDEDQAVRGANLAALYRDAEFQDLSRREAMTAVNDDYANYSAHWLLANSYKELRDPGQLDLRYDTAWFSEFLVANLLAPVGAGTLSQSVSAQEYSRLFEQDRLGVVSLTEYGSRGDWVQDAVQWGILGNFAYALEADYRNLQGQRHNNDLEQLTLGLNLKQQIGVNDSLYFRTVYYNANGGDLSHVYDPSNPAYYRPNLRFQEAQEPLLLAGYHHQWSPGQHTLLLTSRMHDRLEVSDPTQPILLVGKDPTNAVTGTLLTSAEQHYRSELEIYSAEVQHIAQVQAWTVVVGGRAQLGQFEVDNRQQDLADSGPSLPNPLVQHVQPDLQRFTAYTYAQWQIADPLALFGGVSYDYLLFPANYRLAPVLSGEDDREQWSPKAGLVWKATPSTTFRGAYTRSLGGVSLEQSFQLEPSQVAGINQAWRSLIPESAVGSQAGARLETGAVEWDQRFPTETYLAVRGETGRSEVHRQVGVLDQTFFATASSTPERLDFRESTLSVTLNQLVGQSGVLGAQYRLSNASLEDVYPNIPENVPHQIPPFQLRPRQELESTLHQVRLFAGVNYASGLFGQIESLWSSQSNQGYSPARPGDDFWQFNIYAGYRFPKRRAEVRVGVLNLGDQDYRLNPLNLTPELPRSRTFVASLKLAF